MIREPKRKWLLLATLHCVIFPLMLPLPLIMLLKLDSVTRAYLFCYPFVLGGFGLSWLISQGMALLASQFKGHELGNRGRVLLQALCTATSFAAATGLEILALLSTDALASGMLIMGILVVIPVISLLTGFVVLGYWALTNRKGRRESHGEVLRQ